MERIEKINTHDGLQTRANSAEKTALILVAEYESITSLSEALRLTIREAAKNRGLWPVPALAAAGADEK